MIEVDTREKVPYNSNNCVSISHSWGDGWFDDFSDITLTTIEWACRKYEVKYWWADKFCVDQVNVRVKGKQVALMHEIYSHCPIMFLLVDSNVFNTFEKVASEGKTDLELLYRCDVFRRLWTLQEWVLSPCVVILSPGIERSFEFDMEISNMMLMTDWLGSRLENLTQLRRGREWLIDNTDVLLKEINIRNCKLFHDRIYSIYALLPEKIKVRVKVDYLCSYKELYQQWVWMCLILGFSNVLITRLLDNSFNIITEITYPLYNSVNMKLQDIVIDAPLLNICIGEKLVKVENDVVEEINFSIFSNDYDDFIGLHCFCTFNPYNEKKVTKFTNKIKWFWGNNKPLIGKCVLDEHFVEDAYDIKMHLYYDYHNFYKNSSNRNLVAVPLLRTTEDFVKGIIIKSTFDNKKNQHVNYKVGVFMLPRGDSRMLSEIQINSVAISF
jgi:hypothetical protein